MNMNGWIEVTNTMPYKLPEARIFQKTLVDGHLSVIVDHLEYEGEGAQWHLSISHRSNALMAPTGGPAPGRYPTWDEIKDARYRFVPDEVNMAMMLPPKKFYINCHPTTFHLWEIPVKYASDKS